MLFLQIIDIGGVILHTHLESIIFDCSGVNKLIHMSIHFASAWIAMAVPYAKFIWSDRSIFSLQLPRTVTQVFFL